jgi:hypothetical protein
VIARSSDNTEATVKIHMKSILRWSTAILPTKLN